MNPNLKWKAVFILLVVLACVYGLVGMPQFPTSWAQVKSNFGERIKLGLDLRGGTHLILQVKVEQAVGLTNDTVQNQLADRMREQQIIYEGNIEKLRTLTGLLDDTRFVVHTIAEGQVSTFRDLVAQQFANTWEVAPLAGEANSFQLTMRPAEQARIRTQTLDQAVETIERRINLLGLTEPIVAKHGRGENEILIQLPGEGDPNRIKEIIRAGGLLELRLMRDGQTYSSEADCLGAHGGVLPQGTECVPGRPDHARGTPQPAGEAWYLLNRVPAVTGADLRRAQPTPSSDGIPGRFQVDFTLSTPAAPGFGRFTEANIGNRMAIVLDHTVVTAPVINGKITDSGQIEGDFGKEEANDLALVLRAGSLPAEVRYLEERTIGPSLGADSIRKGFTSSVVSLVLVMGFMLLYYRKAGINANIGMVLNLTILLACLAYLQAVLTLPGIAGLILTIGMGVDSNVLIFERIREELRSGKAAASAVEAGFDRAFLTIIDTHVTTIVSCFFLWFASGPVRGFAVTLVLGLAANVFTAVYVSRTLFHWYLARMERGAALSI